MNLLRSFKIIVCVVLVAVTLCGCMNSVNLKDIKDIVVVEGMGIDAVDDELELTLQTLNISSNSGGEMPQGNMTINTTGSGKTIIDAMSALSSNISKKLFFGQNKIIVFGKETTESDFDKRLDYFLRSSNSRPDVAVCMSQTTAEDIMQSKENDSHIPSENIVNLMQSGQDAGVSAYVTTNDILNLYCDDTSDIYLPVLKKDKNSQGVKASGIGLFNDKKLVYITDEEETLGFLIISGKIKNCLIEFETRDLGMVSVEISSVKAKNRVDISDGKMIFVSEIEAQLMINEIENGLTASLSVDKLDEICNDANNRINYLCQKAFYSCRNNSSDSLRVGECLANDSPKSYEKLKDEWDTYFATVDFSANAETHLKQLSDNTQLD